jgi:class 3 adenylate cyclase
MLPLVREIANESLIQETYRNIAEMYLATGDIKQGKEYYTIYETMLHDEHGKAIADLQEQYGIEKQEWEQQISGKQKLIKKLEFKQRVIILFTFIVVCALGGSAAFVGYRLRQQIQHDQILITEAKSKSDELLHNVLPVSIAQDLQKSGTTQPQSFEHVTVCFCDVFEFNKLSASLDPKELLPELNTLFTAFDQIIEGHDCERLKTVGDAYLYVCGMPDENPQHAENVIHAALEILQYLEKRNQYAKMQWQIQVGIHTGRLIGGVVGIKKYVYDVFGDTINIASALKNASEPMRINISETTYVLVMDMFEFTQREPIKVKDKGMMNMFFVEDVA